jgi:3-hydroxyisobutyrate dehydrogenase-like beta-hydroxyacid dehydrogenase
MSPTTDTVIRTGVIGLGAMGLQMARHMAAKGFDVRGHDVDPTAVSRAAAQGVRTADASEVAGHAQVVVVMVATDDQVREVARGLISRLAPGSVICIASSVTPETCQQLAGRAGERGLGLLDTPVVLGQEAANNGTLTVYVGGEERWFPVARPVLSAFGAKVLYLGPSGSGQNGREFRSTHPGAAVWDRLAALGGGVGEWQRRQLVAFALGQEHWQVG